MNFKEIADWLNAKGYKTARGKTFRNAHTDSILKKKRISDEKYLNNFPSEIKNCSIENFDKSILTSHSFHQKTTKLPN